MNPTNLINKSTSQSNLGQEWKKNQKERRNENEARIVIHIRTHRIDNGCVHHQPCSDADAANANSTCGANRAGTVLCAPILDLQLPASARFIVLSDWGGTAVLDKETGLVWERSPSTSTLKWLDASQYCINLTVGNRKGWRLPTIQELSSLLDMSVPSGPKLPSGHPFIINVQTRYYWSSTTWAGNTTLAWCVDMATGSIVGPGKTVNYNFWCVRGGQGVDPQ